MFKRRVLMTPIPLLLFMLAVPASSSAAETVPTTVARPNIVFIVGDDVGFSDLGSYGGEIATPNIDALAQQGVRFANYHTTASCSPTRSMLMTGVDNHRNGLGNMTETMPFEHTGKPGYLGVLNDRVVTIAQMLRDNGYHTYHIGKWHLGSAPEKRPYNRGFERTIALGDTGADNWEQRTYLPVYDKAHWYADGEEHRLPDDFYSSRYFVDKAIEFIDANRTDGRPFFSYIAFQAVHIPVQAPKEFVEKYYSRYDAGWDPIRRGRRERAAELGLIAPAAQLVTMDTTRDWQRLTDEERRYQARLMAVYAGMLEAMDFHVGRLIKHLKGIGEYDNTAFVFLSDNGPEPSDPLSVVPMRAWINLNFSTALEDLGGRGSYAAIGASWASAAASPGAYYKYFAGEGGVRVPLVVSWPAALRRGEIEHSLAHVKDIMPTLLELTATPDHRGNYRGKTVEPITGSSLLPVLSGRAAYTHPPEKPIGYELSGNAALYKGDYKLVRNLPPRGDGRWHLYNISTDPGEAKDLREAMLVRYEDLLADYEAYRSENGVLDMPDHYDYLEQLQHYSTRVIAKRLLPWIAASLALMTLLVWAVRRARATRR